MGRSVHKNEQRLEAALRRIKGETIENKNGTVRDYSKHISQRNRDFILRFLDVARARVSVTRTLFYASKLWRLAQILRDDMEDKAFEEMDKHDVDKLVGIIKTMKCATGKPYSPSSVQDFIMTIKKALQFRAGYGWNSKKYPPEVEDIKTTLKNTDQELPEKLLTREDIEALGNAAQNTRDEAFVHTLYESGARISELLLTKLSDVDFDDYGAVLYLQHGKTGRRKVRLVTSATRMAQWVRTHPHRGDDDTWLWPKSLNPARPAEQWQYNACRVQLRRLAKRAGVDKPVNPHHFRHSRMTELASKGLNQAQQCKFAGWTIGSDMPRVYVHLSMRDVDDAILQLNGIRKPEAEENPLQTCARCEASNTAASKVCHRCMLPLDDKTAVEIEDRKGTLINPEMEKALVKLLKDEAVQERLKEVMVDSSS